MESSFNHVIVRPLEEKYYVETARLVKEHYESSESNIKLFCHSEKIDVNTHFKSLSKEHPEKIKLAAVALINHVVVAFVQINVECTPSRYSFKGGPSQARIETLIANPEATGLGVGKKVLQWCEKTAINHGCTKLSIEIIAENNPAIRRYERRGFVLKRNNTCNMNMPEFLTSIGFRSFAVLEMDLARPEKLKTSTAEQDWRKESNQV